MKNTRPGHATCAEIVVLHMQIPYIIVAVAAAPYCKRNVLRQTLAAINYKDFESKCITISHTT